MNLMGYLTPVKSSIVQTNLFVFVLSFVGLIISLSVGNSILFWPIIWIPQNICHKLLPLIFGSF